jgi:hypothetical protein
MRWHDLDDDTQQQLDAAGCRRARAETESFRSGPYGWRMNLPELPGYMWVPAQEMLCDVNGYGPQWQTLVDAGLLVESSPRRFRATDAGYACWQQRHVQPAPEQAAPEQATAKQRRPKVDPRQQVLDLEERLHEAVRLLRAHALLSDLQVRDMSARIRSASHTQDRTAA